MHCLTFDKWTKSLKRRLQDVFLRRPGRCQNADTRIRGYRSTMRDNNVSRVPIFLGQDSRQDQEKESGQRMSAPADAACSVCCAQSQTCGPLHVRSGAHCRLRSVVSSQPSPPAGSKLLWSLTEHRINHRLFSMGRPDESATLEAVLGQLL